MKNSIFLFIAAISLSIILEAQDSKWINYTYGNEINSIVEEGNVMWIGTTGGLVKVDKPSNTSTFFNATNSGLPNNVVWEIAIDHNGTKWIGAEWSGITAFNEDWGPSAIHNNILSKNEVSFYPNPTSDFLNIEILNNAKISSIEIFNMQGKLFKSIKYNHHNINVRELENGVYIVRIQTTNRELVDKIIKQ